MLLDVCVGEWRRGKRGGGGGGGGGERREEGGEGWREGRGGGRRGGKTRENLAQSECSNTLYLGRCRYGSVEGVNCEIGGQRHVVYYSPNVNLKFMYLFFAEVPGMPTGITTRSQTPDNLVVDWIDGSATRETGISNYSVSCRASTGNPITMV